MSRRYGRNQKRKHKAKVAELSALLDLSKDEFRLLTNAYNNIQNDRRHILQRLERIANNVNDVCRYSASIDAREVHYSALGHDVISVLSLDKIAMQYLSPNSQVPLPSQTMKVIDLNKLEVIIRKHEESFQRLLHVRCKGESAGYYVSEEVLKYMPDLAIHEFSKEIATALLTELHKSYGKRLKG